MASKEEDIAPLHLPLSEGPKSKSRTPFLSDGPRKQIGSVVSGTSRFLVPLGCTKKSKPTPHVFFWNPNRGFIPNTRNHLCAIMLFF